MAGYFVFFQISIEVRARVFVGFEELMMQTFGCRRPFLRLDPEHLFQQVQTRRGKLGKTLVREVHLRKLVLREDLLEGLAFERSVACDPG